MPPADGGPPADSAPPTHTDLRLRPLTHNDVEACMTIEAASYPPPVCEGADLFRAYLRRHASYCWVAVDEPEPLIEGVVVGYVLCMRARFCDAPVALMTSKTKSSTSKGKADTLYLHDMAVAPSYRQRGVGRVLQHAVLDLTRVDNLQTVTLTAVCGAWDYWARRGFVTVKADVLTTEAAARLRAFPAECGDARVMQLQLRHHELRHHCDGENGDHEYQWADLVEDAPTPAPADGSTHAPADAPSADDDAPVPSPDETGGGAVAATAAAAAPVRASLMAAGTSRALSLPAKMSSLPRTRLAMRLDTSRMRPSFLASEVPPPFQIVRRGELPRSIDDPCAAWAAVVHAAGERPSHAAAVEQYEREFAPYEHMLGAHGGPLSILDERMFFLIDRRKWRVVGTATAWFHAPPPPVPEEAANANEVDGTDVINPKALALPEEAATADEADATADEMDATDAADAPSAAASDLVGECVRGGGRVHWVSLVPSVQGRGLAKPLLAAVLRTLTQAATAAPPPEHNASTDGAKDGAPSSNGAADEDAFRRQPAASGITLRTHCQAARAVCMYVEAGFVPAPLAGGDDIANFTPEEGGGWQQLAALGVPVEIPGTDLE